MSDNFSQLYQTIDALLDKEYQVSESLFDLLQQEHQALEQLNVNNLPFITQQKSQQIKLLDELAAEREKVMRQIPPEQGGGINPDLEKYLALRADRSQWWQDFRTLLQNCQRQNTVNGRIIHLSQQSIERSLNIIRSQSNQANVYDTKGNQQTTKSSLHTVKV